MWWAGPQALGARAPSPLETWPTRHSHRCRVFNFLLRLKPRPGLKTLGCYHNPQSADLGGRWMVSEGGALQSHEAGPQGPGTWPTSPCPACGSPAASRIPKMPRCSSAHEKPGLLHPLISCAQSLQPSLTFLLRRNNKVQGARS